MNSSTKAVVLAGVAIVIAIGGYFFPQVKGVFGNIDGPTTYGVLGTNQLKVGTNCGSGFKFSTCSGVALDGVNGFVSSLLATFNLGVLYAYPNATTTASATETLVQADVQNYDTVLLTPNVAGNTTLTFPASSTLSTWLPTAGNHQRVCFVNATTSATAFYTFAGGTGTTLLVASSSATALGAKTIYAQKMGCFDFVRAPATATTFDILGAFTTFL